MSDNLFDRLFELFQTTDTVNWGLAEEITKSIAGTEQPIEPHLAEEYEELALAAHLRLADAGAGIVGAASVVPYPIDPATWARENHRSFRYLFEPLASAMQGEVDGSNPAAAIMGPLGPALTGLQAGSFVGVMSRQAMGQFDLAIPPLDADRAYLIVPNVEAFAAGHGLDAKQVRLWATMHELVHHAATARETVRGHFDSLVARLLEALDFDPSHLMEKLGDLQDRANLENLISEGEGLAALLGGGEAPSAAGELQAAAAFLEGYGDFAVRRAAGPILPGLEAIESAHRGRPGRSLRGVGPAASTAGDRAGPIARSKRFQVLHSGRAALGSRRVGPDLGGRRPHAHPWRARGPGGMGGARAPRLARLEGASARCPVATVEERTERKHDRLLVQPSLRGAQDAALGFHGGVRLPGRIRA